VTIHFPYTRINPKVKNPAGLVQQNLEFFSTKSAEDLATVTGQVDTVQTDLNTAETNIATIQGQIATIQSQITALQAADAKIKSGQATINGGASSVTVTHNYGSTSYDFVCTPRSAIGSSMDPPVYFYAATKQANSIVITVSQALAGAVIFDWMLKGA
jgi:hypothetical protein